MKERNINPKIFLEKFFERKIIRRIISIKYAIFVEKKSFDVVDFAFNFMRLVPIWNISNELKLCKRKSHPEFNVKCFPNNSIASKNWVRVK